jgi:hypothetical protein
MSRPRKGVGPEVPAGPPRLSRMAEAAVSRAQTERTAVAVQRAHAALNELVRRELDRGRDASWIGPFRRRLMAVSRGAPPSDPLLDPGAFFRRDARIYGFGA